MPLISGQSLSLLVIYLFYPPAFGRGYRSSILLYLGGYHHSAPSCVALYYTFPRSLTSSIQVGVDKPEELLVLLGGVPPPLIPFVPA